MGLLERDCEVPTVEKGDPGGMNKNISSYDARRKKPGV